VFPTSSRYTTVLLPEVVNQPGTSAIQPTFRDEGLYFTQDTSIVFAAYTGLHEAAALASNANWATPVTLLQKDTTLAGTLGANDVGKIIASGWTGGYGNAGPWQLDLTTTAPQAGNGTPRFATATEDAGFQQDGVVRMAVLMTGFGALDDLSFCLAQASVTTRNGSRQNPTVLRTRARPVVGRTWSAELDCSANASGRATLFLRRQAASGTMTPFGEVLVAGELLFSESRVVSGGATAFRWVIPSDLALLGLDLHVQGACQGVPSHASWNARRPRVGLSNALDLILGF